MNKKAYIQPSTCTMQIEAQPMMAGSLTQSEDGKTVTGTVSNEEVTSGWADTRRRSLWDDED